MSSFMPSALPVPNIFRRAHHLMTTDNSAGRTITHGMSYLQRISRGGQMLLWQPPGLQTRPLRFDQLDWAAVRQVEILQESSAQAIESMEIEEGLRSIREHAMMRGGGLRMVVITAGTTNHPRADNDQQTFDRTLRERLRSMDRMHWLDDFSRQAALLVNQAGQNLPERLPHIYTTLNAANVFNRTHTLPCTDATRFLTAIDSLPQRQGFEHDIMIGLKEPRADAHARREFNRLPERLYMGFVNALISSFSHFGLMPTAIHMRSYGDHLKGHWSKSAAPSTALQLVH